MDMQVGDQHAEVSCKLTIDNLPPVLLPEGEGGRRPDEGEALSSWQPLLLTEHIILPAPLP